MPYELPTEIPPVGLKPSCPGSWLGWGAYGGGKVTPLGQHPPCRVPGKGAPSPTHTLPGCLPCGAASAQKAGSMAAQGTSDPCHPQRHTGDLCSHTHPRPHTHTHPSPLTHSADTPLTPHPQLPWITPPGRELRLTSRALRRRRNSGSPQPPLHTWQPGSMSWEVQELFLLKWDGLPEAVVHRVAGRSWAPWPPALAGGWGLGWGALQAGMDLARRVGGEWDPRTKARWAGTGHHLGDHSPPAFLLGDASPLILAESDFPLGPPAPPCTLGRGRMPRHREHPHLQAPA